MNWQAYQAWQIEQKLSGKTPPSIEEVILTSLKAMPGVCKREELCSQVAAHTGLYMCDVSEHISDVLTRMKRHGSIDSPARGYWCYKNGV